MRAVASAKRQRRFAAELGASRPTSADNQGGGFADKQLTKPLSAGTLRVAQIVEVNDYVMAAGLHVE